jgi:hypothetical protein
MTSNDYLINNLLKESINSSKPAEIGDNPTKLLQNTELTYRKNW